MFNVPNCESMTLKLTMCVADEKDLNVDHEDEENNQNITNLQEENSSNDDGSSNDLDSNLDGGFYMPNADE
jgi:hypothetical protein